MVLPHLPDMTANNILTIRPALRKGRAFRREIAVSEQTNLHIPAADTAA